MIEMLLVFALDAAFGAAVLYIVMCARVMKSGGV